MLEELKTFSCDEIIYVVFSNMLYGCWCERNPACNGERETETPGRQLCHILVEMGPSEYVVP